MLICVACKTEMRCDKNSVGADFGYGHVYPSDRYKCPNCGQMILDTIKFSIYDPTYNFQKEYLRIEE
jgi:predicted RNA-binding Zn-ribbon protein involved in translation (DUF1610 family)